MNVEYRQRVSTYVREFDLTHNQIYEDEVEFESDIVDFCWIPRPDIERMTCVVRLFDAETRDELTNGRGELVVEANSTERKWMSFSGFGWHDEGRTMPITKCRFEASIDGTDSIDIEIYH